MGFVGLKPFDQMFSSYEFQAIVGVNYVNEGTNFEDYVKNTQFLIWKAMIIMIILLIRRN